MDFFKAQDDSRQATRRLLPWFLPAVGVLFLGMHLIMVMAFRAIPVDLTGNLQILITAEGDYRHQASDLFFHPRVVLCSQIPVLLILLFTVGNKWRELSLGGGQELMRRIDARRLALPNGAGEQKLKNVMQEMAVAAGLPEPAVFVLDGVGEINALCAGFSPHEAVIAVTEGALERLNRDELQALAAHELGHIANRDLALNMRLASLMNGFTQISILGLNATALSGLVMLPAAFFNSQHPNSPSMLFLAFSLLAAFVGMLILATGGIGMVMGAAAQRAIAREREFLADASAVQFARLSEGLAGVLKKARQDIENGMAGKVRNGSVRHMLFQDGEPGWLATHPPIEERLRRLGDVHISRIDRPAERARPERQGVQSDIGYDNPVAARAAVYAVLLQGGAGDSGPQIHMLAGSDSPEAAMKTESLLARFSGLGAREAHHIALRTLPALSGLPLEERQRFLRAAERLALADGEIQPYEQSLLQSLKNKLSPVAARQDADAASIANALALICSTMAHVAGQNGAGQTYAGFQERFPVLHELELRAIGTIRQWEFMAALAVLGRAGDDVKSSLMQGLHDSAMQDGAISEKEEALLNAVSEAIGKAVPINAYQGPWR